MRSFSTLTLMPLRAARFFVLPTTNALKKFVPHQGISVYPSLARASWASGVARLSQKAFTRTDQALLTLQCSAVLYSQTLAGFISLGKTSRVPL